MKRRLSVLGAAGTAALSAILAAAVPIALLASVPGCDAGSQSPLERAAASR
jgi:hypothetical protein